MTRIEDRLTDEGRRLRNEIRASVESDAALEGAPGTSTTGRRARPALLAAAAAVVIAAVVGVGLVVTGDDPEQVVADEGRESTPTSAPTTGQVAERPDIPGRALGRFLSGDAESIGSMAFLGVEDALTDHWASAASSEPAPSVDFETEVVLTFTTNAPGRCRGPLLGLLLEGTTVRPFFDEFGEVGCDLSTAPGTFFLAVDRAGLPESFDFRLDSDLLDGEGPYTLTVDTSENFASFTPGRVQPGSSGLPAPEGPDLAQAEPGREITFDRIGDVSLGQEFGPSEFDAHFESGCGYWGPGEPSHDGDEPLGGLVSIEGDLGTVISIMVRENPRFRTASGLGVGTSLETLERIYGDDLVVDRADGWESPTGGLLGSYVDVAAVRNGDRALTYYLHGDVVHTVKLSSFEFWGDDEGCA